MAVARKSRQLIPGENPAVTEFDAARRWLNIYEHRAALLADATNTADYENIVAGVMYWRARVAELSGLGLDSDRRVISIDSEHDVLLTPRELQLLEFLLQHPHRYFADHVLAVRAWGDRLSGDQVRIYVRRLRTKLAGSGWQVQSRRGYGYALVRQRAAERGAARGESTSAETVQRVVGRARALLQVQRSQLDLAMAAAEQLRKSLDGHSRPG